MVGMAERIGRARGPLFSSPLRSSFPGLLTREKIPGFRAHSCDIDGRTRERRYLYASEEIGSGPLHDPRREPREEKDLEDRVLEQDKEASSTDEVLMWQPQKTPVFGIPAKYCQIRSQPWGLSNGPGRRGGGGGRPGRPGPHFARFAHFAEQ